VAFPELVEKIDEEVASSVEAFETPQQVLPTHQRAQADPVLGTYPSLSDRYPTTSGGQQHWWRTQLIILSNALVIAGRHGT